MHFATSLVLRRYHQAQKPKASPSPCSVQEKALDMLEKVLCQMLRSLRSTAGSSAANPTIRTTATTSVASLATPFLPVGMSGHMTPASSPLAFDPEDEEALPIAQPLGPPPASMMALPPAAALAPMAGSTLSNAQYADAARRLGVSVSALKAVAHVESNGKGMLKSGKPQILFEAHVFARYTGGRYNQSHPHLSSQRWDKSLYGRGGEHQWQRLEAARRLDPHAALMATSFGRFQIMGFNHKAAGYPTVEAFANAMRKGEGEQLKALCNFLASNPRMLNALRREDWQSFARAYNGPDYAANRYDLRLAAAERQFRTTQA